MDKHVMLSIALFALVDLTVLVTYFLPNWVISNVGGEIQIGLWQSCVVSRRRTSTCYYTVVPNEWRYAIRFIYTGCAFATLAVICFGFSVKVRQLANYGRWLGLLSLAFFCLASVAIPMGFNMEQIKGEHFQLPNSFYAGYAYILFNMSIWIVAITELFAGKVCLPNF